VRIRKWCTRLSEISLRCKWGILLPEIFLRCKCRSRLPEIFLRCKWGSHPPSKPAAATIFSGIEGACNTIVQSNTSARLQYNCALQTIASLHCIYAEQRAWTSALHLCRTTDTHFYNPARTRQTHKTVTHSQETLYKLVSQHFPTLAMKSPQY